MSDVTETVQLHPHQVLEKAAKDTCVLHNQLLLLGGDDEGRKLLQDSVMLGDLSCYVRPCVSCGKIPCSALSSFVRGSVLNFACLAFTFLNILVVICVWFADDVNLIIILARVLFTFTNFFVVCVLFCLYIYFIVLLLSTV